MRGLKELDEIKALISAISTRLNNGEKLISAEDSNKERQARYIQKINELLYQQYYCETLFYQARLHILETKEVEVFFSFLADRIQKCRRERDPVPASNYANELTRTDGTLQQVVDMYGAFTTDYEYSDQEQFAEDFALVCVSLADYFLQYRNAISSAPPAI